MINKIILVGYIGKDPEHRKLDNGVSVATFSMATSESYKDKEGNWQNLTEWHKIVAWRGLADLISNKYRKGNLVYVEGKVTHRKYTDANGQEKYITEVVAAQARKLEKSEKSAPPPPVEIAPVESKDDLPF